jgi:hypothetical protein
MRTLLQQMLEIDGDESRQEWFEGLTPGQRVEVMDEAKEALEPLLRFITDVYIPSAIEIIKKFTEWMRDISPIIEAYSTSLKSEDTEKIIKNFLIRDEP